MGLFTVNFELGEKTRETLRQIAKTSVVRFELGPETRALIERLAAPRGDGKRAEGGERTVGRLVEQGGGGGDGGSALEGLEGSDRPPRLDRIRKLGRASGPSSSCRWLTLC